LYEFHNQGTRGVLENKLAVLDSKREELEVLRKLGKDWHVMELRNAVDPLRTQWLWWMGLVEVRASADRADESAFLKEADDLVAQLRGEGNHFSDTPILEGDRMVAVDRLIATIEFRISGSRARSDSVPPAAGDRHDVSSHLQEDSAR
jgi:hypothetical protein